MKQTALILLLAGALASPALTFVCGKAAKGATALTAHSVYSATTPGFDLQTIPQCDSKSCSSDKPFFYSLALPEGSYRVTVTLGSAQPSTTTVWAEARRLMLEKIPVGANGSDTREFDVNLRVPAIAGDASHSVHLKPREVGNLDWDAKLTLEFNGVHPGFRALRIEPRVTP